MIEIEDDLALNYRQVREDRGWTWAQMAEQFDRDAETALRSGLPGQDAGDRHMAAWCRQQDEREGTTPEQPRRGGRKKRTTEAQPAPHRTDAPTAEAAADDDLVDDADDAVATAGVPVAV